MRTQTKSVRRGRFAALSLAATLALGGTSAFAADRFERAAELPVLDRKGPLERSVEAHVSRERYEAAFEQAKRFDIEPKRNLADSVARAPELEVVATALKVEVAGEKAKQKVKEENRPEEPAKPEAASVGTPESVGVNQGTLETIAACESGGDPTVIDASGTYHGKYQFDLTTWASVGGSGNPAAAPEAEQDYRAALLYSQAGSSPWPVCGV